MYVLSFPLRYKKSKSCTIHLWFVSQIQYEGFSLSLLFFFFGKKIIVTEVFVWWTRREGLYSIWLLGSFGRIVNNCDPELTAIGQCNIVAFRFVFQAKLSSDFIFVQPSIVVKLLFKLPLKPNSPGKEKKKPNVSTDKMRFAPLLLLWPLLSERDHDFLN